MNDNHTLVIFRRWRDSGGIIALFPEIPSDIHGHYCDAYEHIGQHSGADYHACVQDSDPVTTEVAQHLIEELTRIGYNLKPIKRASRLVHDLRRAEAKRIRSASV